MLNLHCPICVEIFADSDHVNCTSCGHMFHIVCLNEWLQRSKTCPQCRKKCTQRNVFRVYFNLANSDESRIDVSSLQEQLDCVQLQLEIKESKANQLTKSLDDAQKLYMKRIADLEQNLQSKNCLLLDHVEKIRMLERQNKEMESLQKECRTQKRQIERMDFDKNGLKWKYAKVRNALELAKNQLRQEIKDKKLLDEKIQIIREDTKFRSY